jgi:hypothetical protein
VTNTEEEAFPVREKMEVRKRFVEDDIAHLVGHIMYDMISMRSKSQMMQATTASSSLSPPSMEASSSVNGSMSRNVNNNDLIDALLSSPFIPKGVATFVILALRYRVVAQPVAPIVPPTQSSPVIAVHDENDTKSVSSSTRLYTYGGHSKHYWIVILKYPHY